MSNSRPTDSARLSRSPNDVSSSQSKQPILLVSRKYISYSIRTPVTHMLNAACCMLHASRHLHAGKIATCSRAAGQMLFLTAVHAWLQLPRLKRVDLRPISWSNSLSIDGGVYRHTLVAGMATHSCDSRSGADDVYTAAQKTRGLPCDHDEEGGTTLVEELPNHVGSMLTNT